MKTRVLIAALVIGALLCSGIVSAEAPPKATIQEVTLIHYQDDKDHVKEKVAAGKVAAKPTRAPKPTATATPGPADAEPTPTVTATSTPTPTATQIPVDSDLYKLLGKRWTAYPVNYYIDPVGSGLNADAVAREVSTSFETWDSEVNPDLFEYAGTTVTAGYNNGRNEVYWLDLSDERIVAKARYIYSSSGAFIEADIQMNSMLRWGIDQDGEGTQYALTDQFDVRNIVMHESGHVCGLADLYDNAATDLTMFGYSSAGQVTKDSLGLGDILGIRALYGV